MTITEFLLARIEEDEKVARAAIRSGDGTWTAGEQFDVDGEVYDRCAIFGDDLHIYDEGGHDEEQAEHIARHDPARVLAESAAKRAIVELHRPIEQLWWPEQVPVEVCEMCDEERWECETICALASVYASHPDYREEWAL